MQSSLSIDLSLMTVSPEVVWARQPDFTDQNLAHPHWLNILGVVISFYCVFGKSDTSEI